MADNERSVGPGSLVITQAEDIRGHADEIAQRVNRDPMLGILFLVDPARVLAECGYELSGEAASALRRRVVGVTRAQREGYDRIKQRLQRGETVSGLTSVRLVAQTSRQPGADPAVDAASTSYEARENLNPLGGFDFVAEISEDSTERLVQLAYEEDLIPHRPDLPRALGGGAVQLVLGRPILVSFSASTAGSISLTLPVALLSPLASPQRGELTLEASVSTEEVAGRPARFRLQLTADPVLTGQGLFIDGIAQLIVGKRDELEAALNDKIGALDLTAALDALAKKAPLGGGSALTVDDLELKVNSPGGPPRSLSVCVDMAPNDGAGQLWKVGQLAPAEWAAVANERVLHQAFDRWWASPDGQRYHRLSKDALENYHGGGFDSICDPDGSIAITKIGFAVEKDRIAFDADFSIDDVWCWTLHATATANVELSIGPTGMLRMLVKDADFSLSCLSKFLVGLFCFTLGFVAGAILGGAIGAVLGGIVGAAVAGAELAVKTAAVNDQLDKPQSLDVFPVHFDLPLPGSTLLCEGTGQWVAVWPGEIALGGALAMPPLAEPSITVPCVEHLEQQTAVELPWDEPGPLHVLSSWGNYLVTTAERYRLEPVRLMEGPLLGTWRVDGEELPDEGDEVRVTVVPKVRSVATGDTDGVLVDTVVRVVKSDGSLGEATVISQFLAGTARSAWAYVTLEVTATDVLGTRCEASVRLHLKVLGDRWLDQSYEWFTQGVPLPFEVTLPPGLAGPPTAQSQSTGVGRVDVGDGARMRFRRLELAGRPDRTPEAQPR